MGRVAIIAAMAGELEPLVRGWQHERRNGVDLWRWRYDKGEWIAVCAGAGIDAATRSLAEAEKDGRIHRVISTGWAGALRSYIEPGIAYCVSGVIDSHTGERIPVADWRQDIWLVTSPVVADDAEKKRLADTYDAGLVDMEAAGVARLAAMRRIPFYCIKGISDGFADKLPDFNRFISANGQFQLVRFILFAILRPWHWPALMQMGENSKKAAQSIKDSLLHFLDHDGIIRRRNGYPNFSG